MATARRVVTGHDDDGKAIFTSDDTMTPVDPTKGDQSPASGKMAGFVTIHRTEGSGTGLPVNVQTPFQELHGKQIPLSSETAVTCRIVDFPPVEGDEAGNIVFMHRTQSLDYGIVLKGSITLVLDDNVETTVHEGDIVVQRGTIHAWKNVSGEVCRVVFVLVPAEPVRVKNTGEVLEPTDISHLLPPTGPTDQS